MADSSGNARHGIINPLGFSYSPVFGLAKAIETDSGGYAMGGGCGYVAVTSGTALDVRAAFSLEGWGKQIGGGGGVLIARNGGPGFSASNWIALDQGIVRFRLSDGSTTWDLTSSALVEGAWYHVVGTRNTNVMRLYLNGVLVAERTDLAVGDFVYDNYNSSSWKVGASANTVVVSTAEGRVNVSDVCDEVAIYGSALTTGRILAHYEAALATLPMSATITVRVVVELDTDQVVPVDFPFAHNFADAISGSPRPIVEHLAYKTNVNQSEPDYQQRINAQPYHAERTLEYAFTPISSRARAMMQAALWTPGTIYKLPIGNDWGTLTTQAAASANTLSLDTTIRDYEVGSYVCVWQDVYEPWGAQFFEITSRSDTQLGITPTITTTFPSGSPVMPARLARLPEDSLSIDSHTIDRETALLQFEVLSTELSSRRITAYTPATTYLSLEVFSLERARVEWLDPTNYQINRRFQGTGTPTGNDYQRAVDTGSPQTVPLRVLLTTRAAISEFYGWMDARQGKINPVWIKSEEADLTAVGQSAGSLTVPYIGFASLYGVHSARRHIAIKKTDGTTIFRRITAVVNNGDGTETISIPSAPALADISKVSFLRLCTAPDQFELRYHRDGLGFVAECEFMFSELLTTPE